MIAVLWAELAGWRNDYARRTIWPVVFILAAIGYYLRLRPEYMLLLLSLLCFWFASAAGERGWSRTSCVDWIKRTGIGPWRVTAGKMAAALAVVLLVQFFALPVMVLMAAMWGVPYAALGQAALAAAIGSLTAAGLGLSGSMLSEGEELYTGKFFITVWLSVTAFVPRLSPINPLKQVWTLMTSRAGGIPPLGLIAGLGVAALCWLVSGLLLRWEAGRR